MKMIIINEMCMKYVQSVLATISINGWMEIDHTFSFHIVSRHAQPTANHSQKGEKTKKNIYICIFRKRFLSYLCKYLYISNEGV